MPHLAYCGYCQSGLKRASLCADRVRINFLISEASKVPSTRHDTGRAVNADFEAHGMERVDQWLHAIEKTGSIRMRGAGSWIPALRLPTVIDLNAGVQLNVNAKRTRASGTYRDYVVSEFQQSSCLYGLCGVVNQILIDAYVVSVPGIPAVRHHDQHRDEP